MNMISNPSVSPKNKQEKEKKKKKTSHKICYLVDREQRGIGKTIECNAFPVKVDRAETVHALKKLITGQMPKYSKDTNLLEHRLWHVCIPVDDGEQLAIACVVSFFFFLVDTISRRKD